MTSVYRAAAHLCGEHLHGVFPKDSLVGNNDGCIKDTKAV